MIGFGSFSKKHLQEPEIYSNFAHDNASRVVVLTHQPSLFIPGLLFSFLRIFGHFYDSIWDSNPPKTYQNNLYIRHKKQQE